MPKARYLSYLIIAFLLFSCSTLEDYSSESLANQGILPLSDTNAFLGTNLFLSKQAQASNVLFNFLDARGAPAALELIDKSFEKPRMILYYPRAMEAYAGDLEEQDGRYQWIIRGPFAIKRTDFSLLSRIQSGLKQDPVFSMRGRLMRFRADEQSRIARLPVATATPTPTPTRTPVPRKKVVKKKVPVISSQDHDVPDLSKEFKPLNADQQALQMSKGFAERASNGDVIHTVKRDGETLAEIAKWYTGDASNEAAIRSANSLDASAQPGKGQRIRVPLKLLKKLKAMP